MNQFKREFNTEELCNWINLKLHFGEEYSNILIQNHLNGESFIRLDLNELGEMGIKIVGHRLSFFNLIRTERKRFNIAK